MLWKTHIRIANEILFRLNLSKSGPEADQLREGSITPDKWKDYPHHEGKSHEIRKRLLNARKFYLTNDLCKAYFELGIALHYIQDGFTTLTSRSKHHSRWEQQIEQSYFTNDLQHLIDRAFQNDFSQKREYSKYVRALLNDVNGRDDTLWLASMQGPGISSWQSRRYGKPHVDLNFALRASYIVAKSVLSSKHNPELQKNLYTNETFYQTKLKETETRTAKELIMFIEKYNALNTKKFDGFFKSILNKVYTWIAKNKTNHYLNHYLQKTHLTSVTDEYQRAVRRITSSHYGWYNFCVPNLDINIVQNELLSEQEVTTEFRITEQTIQSLIATGSLQSYSFKNNQLFQRSLLEKVIK